MHPLLGRRADLALYLLLWLAVGGLLAALLASQGMPWGFAAAVAVPLSTAFSFVCLSAWYVSRGMPLGGTGVVRIGATALTAAVVSAAVWLLLARGWMALVAPRFGVTDVRAVAGFYDVLLFAFGVLLYLLSVSASYLISAYEASQASERRGLHAQVLAREAELRALRAQVDPHFLFNSLHSISALTASDPAGARRMCLLLADFLRESLSLGVQLRIPLARELALARRFLEIEQVRFGTRLQTDIDAGNAGDCLVPPLLLQPLVENAVTHGIAHVVEGGVVSVSATRRGGLLTLVAENPCDPEWPRRAGAGVGLGNVRARLRALHGQDASVIAGEHRSVWRVEIVMPAVTELR